MLNLINKVGIKTSLVDLIKINKQYIHTLKNK